MTGCPSQADLNVFVDSGEPDGDVRRHVGACPPCQERVEELRREAAFIDRFRAAKVTDGPPTLGPHGPGPEPDPAARPDLIDGYRILGEVYRGGQGVIYRAVQIPTQRTVAIKMLLAGRSHSARDRERFEREARIAAGLRHPNIVTVYDGGFIADGRYAFAMEYIEGEPLDQWSARLGRARAREGRRALRERLTVMAKVCDAVLYAHQHAIVHRDLKPANIIVDSAGEPHVLDFGIARDLGPEAHTRLTHTGAFAGTLAYASPEQVSGDPSRVDTRTDIYSLGVILYEMVSGRMPYRVDGPMSAAIRSIEGAEPMPLRGRGDQPDGPFVDDEVSTIILKAMAKEPARRYQTAAGLGNDIKRYLAGEAIEARRDSSWYVLRKAAARHRLPLLTALLVFASVAVFGLIMAWQRERLAVALSNSTIERGRARVQLDNIPEAESLLWAELLQAPRGVERWNPDDYRLPLSRAWWALWELYAANPCADKIRRTDLGAQAPIRVLLPVPGRDDLVLIAGDSGCIELRTLPDLALKAGATCPTDPKQGRPASIMAGAFTPEGVLVTFADDYIMRRWDGISLEPRGAAFPRTQPPEIAKRSVALSANGARFAMLDGSGIRSFDVACGRPLETASFASNGFSPNLMLSPDAEWLAMADGESVGMHRVGKPEAVTRAPFGSNVETKCMTFSRSGGEPPHLFFAVGYQVFLLDPERPGEARRFAAVKNVSYLSRIALSNDDRWLAVASDDRRISLWDARSASDAPAIPYLAAHDAPVTSLCFTSDGRSLLSGHDDGVVQRWDLSDLAGPRRGAFMPLVGHSDSVFAVAVAATAGGVRGYSSAYDRTVRAWDLDTGQQAGCSSPLGGRIDSIALSPDGRTIAAAIDVGNRADVAFLDTDTLRIKAVIENAHSIRCADLDFSPDGASLATVGQDSLVRVWSMPAMDENARFQVHNPRDEALPCPPLHTVRFSPDGRALGWGASGGIANLADPSLASPPQTLPGNRQTVRCLRFSPDGRRLAIAGNDSTVWVGDTSTGRTIHEMKGHVGTTYAIGFSPDGRVLASGGDDGTVRLWDTASGDNLAILRDTAATQATGLAVFTVEFTPDGDHLFVGGNRGYLGVWDLRYYDRHVAGNLEYQLDRLKKQGGTGANAAAAKRWAEQRKHAATGEK